MTVSGLLLIATLIMKFWPETGCARWLRGVLIARPLALLARIGRRHIIFLIVGFGVMYSFSVAGMPHLGAIAAVDVSAYVDAQIVGWTVTALTRARGGWTMLRSRFDRSVRRTAASAPHAPGGAPRCVRQ
jgi:hypothetical protein